MKKHNKQKSLYAIIVLATIIIMGTNLVVRADSIVSNNNNTVYLEDNDMSQPKTDGHYYYQIVSITPIGYSYGEWR